VSERMILLTRAVAVFAVNAVLGLAASAASGAVASLTFGWLLPMTAICGVTLAVAVAARSATVGALVVSAVRHARRAAGHDQAGGALVLLHEGPDGVDDEPLLLAEREVHYASGIRIERPTYSGTGSAAACATRISRSRLGEVVVVVGPLGLDRHLTQPERSRNLHQRHHVHDANDPLPM
ncbi:MAG: hypothetical protein ACRDP5_17010, partial [Streptosporangiaceae bacterium]